MCIMVQYWHCIQLILDCMVVYDKLPCYVCMYRMTENSLWYDHLITRWYQRVIRSIGCIDSWLCCTYVCTYRMNAIPTVCDSHMLKCVHSEICYTWSDATHIVWQEQQVYTACTVGSNKMGGVLFQGHVTCGPSRGRLWSHSEVHSVQQSHMHGAVHKLKQWEHSLR